MKIFIDNCSLLRIKDKRDMTVLEKQYVLIDKGRIKKIGTVNDEAYLTCKDEGEEILLADGQLLMPGMLNGHTHLFQTFTRGFSDGRSLFTWLKEYIWPFISIMEAEDFYLSALVGAVENIKSGATSVIDQHYVHIKPEFDDETIRAMKVSGIRGTYCRTFGNINVYDALLENDDHIKREAKRLIETYHNSENGRIKVSLGPLNPWGITEQLMMDTYQIAEDYDTTYQIHTAETKGVVDKTLEMYGLRNIPLFEKLGVLSKRTQLAHSIWLEDEELDTIKKYDASVIYNPVANMILGDGTAKIPLMREKGITVTLGTDGPGSNDREDMFEVLKTGALLQKNDHLNPEVLDRYDMLDMAFCESGKAVLDDSIGLIEEGYKADLLLVNLKKSHIMPIHDYLSSIVFNCCGSDVETVIIDGEIIMKDRKMLTVDEESLLSLCQERLVYLRKKANW